MKSYIKLCAATLLSIFAIQTSAIAEPYFPANLIPPTTIAPPIEIHSPEWNAEIDSIIALQQNPDEEEVAKAAAERNMTPEMVSLAIMPELARQAYPKTYALLDRVAQTSKGISRNAKIYWDTKRPFIVDERIKPLIDPHNSPAYPSGHTTGSYTWAYVLSMVIPEKRAAFMARAEKIAQHRVLVGVHFPHDLRGGKELAALIIGGLLTTPAFQVDLAAAKAEISTQVKDSH